MSAIKGDFIGFTYNGVHSSELGIVRVSGGSRFEENLLPTMSDKTTQVPGGDGTYFFGSYYTQRQFKVSFAFDSLTESNLRRMRQLFGDKEIHDLIFDELPFKVYSAKVTGNATIKHICFDEGETNRLYKGEGTIQFTAFYPYARSRFKYLSQYIGQNNDNLNVTIPEWRNKTGNIIEWKTASGMLEDIDKYDSFSESGVNNNIYTAYLYNPGDLDVDFKLYLPISNEQVTFQILLEDSEQINITNLVKNGSDNYVCLNSKTNLIEGCKLKNNGTIENLDFITTGTLYNSYISGGNFFKIPLGESTIQVTGLKPIGIDYKYLYI